VSRQIQKDSIIISAWPETPVSAVGMWYDAVPKLLGILKNGYYNAGHAAAVLVNHKTKKLHYFDFGRYHMPQKYGRVRDEQSDPGLKIPFDAIISDDNKLLNINEILLFLNSNKECHGKGVLYASVLENISFEKAYKFAKGLQNADVVNYGPYDLKGSNCSRFIASLAKAGNPKRKIKFRLAAPLLFTPMPKGNVVACNSEYYSVLHQKIEKRNVNFFDLLKNFVIPYISIKNKRKNETEFQHQANQIQFQNAETHA